MHITEEVYSLVKDEHVKFSFETTNECPLCKGGIEPVFIRGVLYNHGKRDLKCTVFNFCNKCYSPFLSTYKASSIGASTYEYKGAFDHSEPNRPVNRNFEKDFTDTFGTFVEVYNDALAAETYGLDHISGMGYRKALEFLVKSFAILRNPDKEEEIAPMPLSKCISEYIDSKRIKEVSMKCTWLSNDETHYAKKHECELEDVKRLLNAVIFYVNEELTLDFSKTIEKK